MLENDSGHRPLAYVKSQQIRELLQESEQKVRFVSVLHVLLSLLVLNLLSCKHFGWLQCIMQSLIDNNFQTC